MVNLSAQQFEPTSPLYFVFLYSQGSRNSVYFDTSVIEPDIFIYFVMVLKTVKRRVILVSFKWRQLTNGYCGNSCNTPMRFVSDL